MIEVEQEARKRVERALIVGTALNSEDSSRGHCHLDELAELLRNMRSNPISAEKTEETNETE